jgi:hypothetical protein
MQDMERQKFEDAWKNAFKEAELSPPEDIWTNIELELEKSESIKMKNSVQRYKMLAAACIIFTIGVSSFSFYLLNNQSNTATANQLAFDNAQETTNHTTQVKKIESSSTLHSKDAANNLYPSLSSKNNNHGSQEESSSVASLGGSSSNSHLSKKLNQHSGDVVQYSNKSIETIHEMNNQASLVNETSISTTKTTVSKLKSDSDKSTKTPDRTKGMSEDFDDNKSSLVASTSKENPANRTESTFFQGNNATLSTITYRGFSSDQSVNLVFPENKLLADEQQHMGIRPHVNYALDQKRLPSLVNRKSFVLVLPEKAEPDPVVLMLARLDKHEKEISAKANKKSEKRSKELWTSVGFSAGAFNTVKANVPSSSVANSHVMSVYNGGPRAQLEAEVPSQSIAKKEAKASGASYTVGLNFGTKIFRRWILQGGVNYLTRSSHYTDVLVIYDQSHDTFRAASSEDVDRVIFNETFSGGSQEKLIGTTPYTITNNLQYVNIPVQAGYLIMDKKLGLQLNAGVSTDLFLQNNKTTEGKNIEDASHSNNYRSVNFSGLAGTELTYRIGDHYCVALNPGIRYSFNSIYKAEKGIESIPVTYDIGLRFRYNFY